MKAKIESLIQELVPKVKELVPDRGDFKVVYSEFENSDNRLCLTDIMLKVESVPHCIKNYMTRRYLVCVGYKLPAPVKSSVIIKAGTKQEILDFLNNPSLVDKVYDTVQSINYNMLDVRIDWE